MTDPIISLRQIKKTITIKLSCMTFILICTQVNSWHWSA